VAGLSAPQAIGRHKRLKAYSFEDFQKVQTVASYFQQIVTCSHVLTETSNLIGQTNDAERAVLLAGLKQLILSIEEVRIPSVIACDHPAYTRLGLTDAVLLTMDIAHASLLTVDLGLTLAAQAAGKQAINYNWIRENSVSRSTLGIS
jgi:hypothetical protein